MILNDLQMLSIKDIIKAIRYYIIIHRCEPEDCKTKLLNEILNLKGYKFCRRKN